MVIGALNQISNNSDELVQTGIDIVTSLVSAIIEAAPYLVEAAVNLAWSLGEALINTDWVSVGTDLMTNLKDSIDLAAGEILGMDTATVDGFLEGISNALPNVLDTGIEFITNVADGILQNIPNLITTAGELITTFASFIMQNMPTIMQKGTELMLNLVNGIINNLPKIAESVVKIIAKFVSTVAQNLPQILKSGIEIIGKLVVGLLQAIPQIVNAIPQIVDSIKNTFSNVDWGSIGHNLIEGIADGIRNAAGWIIDAARDAAQSAFDAACSWLGINSPATKGIYIGEMLDKGVALGVEDNMGIAESAVEKLADTSLDSLTMTSNPSFAMAPTSTQSGDVIINMSIYGAEGQDINELATLVEEKISNSIMRRRMAYA